jgi:hypothetical protein
MKDYCQTMFLPYYRDAIGLDDDIGGQLDYETNISRNVVRLIGKSSEFHYGPVDAMVSFLYNGLIFFLNMFPRGKNRIWRILALARSV